MSNFENKESGPEEEATKRFKDYIVNHSIEVSRTTGEDLFKLGLFHLTDHQVVPIDQIKFEIFTPEPGTPEEDRFGWEYSITFKRQGDVMYALRYLEDYEPEFGETVPGEFKETIGVEEEYDLPISEGARLAESMVMQLRQLESEEVLVPEVNDKSESE